MWGMKRACFLLGRDKAISAVHGTSRDMDLIQSKVLAFRRKHLDPFKSNTHDSRLWHGQTSNSYRRQYLSPES